MRNQGSQLSFGYIEAVKVQVLADQLVKGVAVCKEAVLIPVTPVIDPVLFALAVQTVES